MEWTTIALLIILKIAVLILIFRKRNPQRDQVLYNRFDELQGALTRIESGLKEEFRINREENLAMARDNRLELNNTLKDLRDEVSRTLKTQHDNQLIQLDRINRQIHEQLKELISQAGKDNTLLRDKLEQEFIKFQQAVGKNGEAFNELQREKFAQLEDKQNQLVKGTERKLEEMRVMVDEKLQKTLSERLGQSFELVGKQLESVQKGLGEMQTLAQDVGGLKRVLSNVKMRGGIGEVQLAMLLEQVLAPEQYEANVCTKKSSGDHVEFAVKLPGRDDHHQHVYLPIDAKFPKDVYEKILDAYDVADPAVAEAAGKVLESTIKRMARDIHDKYIDPPHTTDFAIMFLPFEGIYAEVVRRASLLEQLQGKYKVIVTGPTTLAAILNSLQMGFRTMAIQKRSSEVWSILGAVKKEFENFGGMLEKAQKNIQTASNQIDEVMGKRTRAIQRKLKNVESLEAAQALLILPELTENGDPDEEVLE